MTIINGDAGENEGGGVYANGSDIIVIDCIFDSNSASGDGGGAVSALMSSFSFTNCKFTGNTSNGSYGGGAVYSSYNSPSVSFTHCAFTNNTARDGGAVYHYYNASFANCKFTGNTASSCGGAVHAYSFSSSFSECIFVNNSASYKGGAIYYYFQSSASSSFTNCTLTGNNSNYGGAVYFLYSSSSPNYISYFTNCTFSLNEATSQGGSIWCNLPLAPEDPITLRNCILWDNTALEGSEIYEENKPLVITYSNIEGGHTGTGNINEDPLFINDFHLQLTSPCIDTGTAEGAPSNDLDGNFRPTGSGYDMGAYEFQGPIIIDSFTANPNTGKPSLTVNFECTAHDDSNTITEYQWNFGDGNSNTTLTGTIQHTYIIPGTFTATCTVVNDNSDQTTASTTIEVTNDIPIADAGSDQIVAGSSVELDGSNSSDPDGTINSWQWTLTHTENSAYNRSGSGEIVYLSNLEFGHYTVVLTVTDNFGAHGTDEMFLSVAGSTGNVYSQEDLDQTRQDGYLVGLDEGLNNSGNTIAGIIEETVEGDKVIDGPLIIKGCLIIK